MIGRLYREWFGYTPEDRRRTWGLLGVVRRVWLPMALITISTPIAKACCRLRARR